MILGKKKTMPDSQPREAVPPSDAGGLKDAVDTAANKEQGGASMWGNKGNALVESSMYADAIKCYDKALEINPKSMEVLNNKGLALARTGRLAEAIDCYDKALELKPDDSEVIYNKGIALAQLGKLADAVDCYDKILASNPNDAEAWCSKGDVLFESGRLYEEALQAYDKSIAINPKDETAWNNRGMTLVKLNRFAEAIESYDKALEINPKVEKIWSNKGFAISKMRETQEKIDLQKLASTMPKDDKAAPINKPGDSAPGTVSAQPGEQKSAAAVEPQFSTQASIMPDKQESKPELQDKNKLSGEYLVKGNSLYSSGKYEEAAGYFGKSLELDPGNGTAWNNKGLALGKSGRVDEAIDCYDRALGINSRDHVVLNNKGNALLRKGKITEAMVCYKSALELRPDNKTAMRGIEICTASMNKSQK